VIIHLFFFNGNIHIKCYYFNGKLKGKYKCYYENGNIEKVYYYINNKLEGEYKHYDFYNKQYIHYIHKCNYKNNLLEGKYIVYYDDIYYDAFYYCGNYNNKNMISVECNYKNNLLDGEYKKYYDNGNNYYIFNIKNNKINDKITVFDSEGSIKKIYNEKNLKFSIGDYIKKKKEYYNTNFTKTFDMYLVNEYLEKEKIDI
jgi:antitoxin component YwqK of YwqJK toxin-antitoxin module